MFYQIVRDSMSIASIAKEQKIRPTRFISFNGEIEPYSYKKAFAFVIYQFFVLFNY